MYTDDLSGNCSRQWNKFDVWCLALAGLPLDIGRQFANIYFLACSNKVPATDMTAALVKELLELQNGVIVFDAYMNQDFFLIALVMCILADNARASELTNHLGATAKRFCRICMVIP